MKTDMNKTKKLREAYLIASALIFLVLGCTDSIALAAAGVLNLAVAALLNPEYIG